MVNKGSILGKLLLGCAIAAWASVPAANAHEAKKLKPPKEKVLYNFCAVRGCPDGFNLQAGLVTDAAGNFYGVTESGGANDQGTIFKVTPAGVETVLYSFCSQANCADGLEPTQSLAIDSAGNLYGTTFVGGDTSCGFGGEGCGVVFELASGGAFSVLHQFTGGTDGAAPDGGLLVDASGDVYGTTQQGGSTSCYFATGCGTVFEIPAGGSETVLYDFCSQANCTDGSGPSANLIMDQSGNLYGTTGLGGTGAGCGGGNGCGTVFELAPGGAETVLYNFCSQANCSDGASPYSGVIMDATGNLYGVTHNGNGSGCSGSGGCGVVFELAPNGTETVLYGFTGGSDGGNPDSGLVMDGSGNLYGTTPSYGATGHGTAYRVSPGGAMTVLYGFCQKTKCHDGSAPVDNGSLVISNGNLYGTGDGGKHLFGSIFYIENYQN
jgi:uncharacterized repeat protein (TIGR03803 family)